MYRELARPEDALVNKYYLVPTLIELVTEWR